MRPTLDLSSKPLAGLRRLRLLLLVGVLAAASVSDAQESASRVVGSEEHGLGAVRVPCALPPWLSGDPLEAIGRQLEQGDGSEGREMLLRLLRERGGGLILPDRAIEGRDAIDPPWQILGDWYASLPAESQRRLRLPKTLAEREFRTGPIDGASPLIWLPGLDDLAHLRREEAIETGDRATAILLGRRPGLDERLHPILRRWLESDTGREPAPLEPPLPSGAFHLEAQAPIGLASNPLDNLDTTTLPVHRRVPIIDIDPAIGNGVAIIPGDRGAFALDLSPPYQRLWNLPIAYPGSEPTPGPMRDKAWIAKFVRGRLIAPLRTPRPEYSPTNLWVHEDPDLNDWHFRGWTDVGSFRWAGGPKPPQRVRTPRLAIEGFTVGGVPCVHGGRVHWIATRGFDEVETWVFALDLATGQEVWRSHIATVSLPWHAMNDLAGLLPEGRIVPYRDELFIVTRGGALGRVGASLGDLRGVLLYPRMKLTPQTGKWGLYHFAHVPAFRPRYLSDAWIDLDSHGRARLIALPPDSTLVLGIDVEAWELSWAHRAPSLALLKRDFDDTPWVIDLSIPIGEGGIEVRSLEAANGRLRETKVTLEIPMGRKKRVRRTLQVSPTSTDVAPLIAGVPSLVGGSLAIPLKEGWAFWSRSPLIGGPPDKVIPWPEGSSGGTVHPIGNDRYLVIHRADPQWQSRSLVEILRTEKPVEPSPGTPAPPPPDGTEKD